MGGRRMRWTAGAIENLTKAGAGRKKRKFHRCGARRPSRNAVIGKANRWDQVGGDGRARRPAGAPARRGSGAMAGGPRSEPGPGGRKSRPLPRVPVIPGSRPGEERKAAWIFAEAEVGEMRRVRLADIGEVNLQMAARRSDERGFRLLRPRDGRRDAPIAPAIAGWPIVRRGGGKAKPA